MNSIERTCKECGNNTFYEGVMGNYVTIFPKDVYWTGMNSGNHVEVLICKKCREIISMKATNTLGFVDKEVSSVDEETHEERIVKKRKSFKKWFNH